MATQTATTKTPPALPPAVQAAPPVPPIQPAAADAPPPRKIKPFPPLSNSHQGDYAALHFTVTLRPGDCIQDCLDPEFWGNASILRPGAIVVARDSRLTEWAEFLVRAIQPNDAVHGIKAGAYLTMLRHYQFAPIKVEVRAKGYEIRYLGPELLWSIVRLIDNSPIATNFQTRDAAAEHLATSATGPA
jgi:hypothetical protein